MNDSLKQRLFFDATGMHIKDKLKELRGKKGMTFSAISAELTSMIRGKYQFEHISSQAVAFWCKEWKIKKGKTGKG